MEFGKVENDAGKFQIKVPSSHFSSTVEMWLGDSFSLSFSLAMSMWNVCRLNIFQFNFILNEIVNKTNKKKKTVNTSKIIQCVYGITILPRLADEFDELFKNLR